jgi:redox-sensitive bicupin YhaK (pirin superfamily)
LAAITPTVFSVQRSNERACFDHGWLQTCHSFSFADYYDPRNVNWGALRVLNDDVVQPGEGFPTHPHRDMEIITYVLAGKLEHRDSTGSHGVVGPGGTQFMSAGTGIRHSEYNGSKTEPLHLLQMWVVPGRLGTPPSYGQVEFPEAERVNTLLAIASGRKDVRAPVPLTQDAAFYASRVETGHHVRHVFEPDRLGFLFVAEGSASVEARDYSDRVVNTETLQSGDAARMRNVTHLKIEGAALIVLWDVPEISEAGDA